MDGQPGRVQPVAIELKGLHRRFHDMVAVHDLSLAIGRGEFFTFLGPSGCGKTTTLRMIAGLLEPDAGEILFDGRPVTRVPPWERNIGMVFQNYALWPHMTVSDNVAFGLVERRVPHSAIAGRVDDALKLVGLEGLGGRLPSQLSGGQQQRVALARAIVVEPALLLLDEPLSNLDARLRIQMRNELVKLQKQLGITTIYVTHDQDEALMLSTRIAVMHRGHLVQLGTPQDVYERPADVFVADFLGGANFLPGTVRRVWADEVVVALDGGAPDARAADERPVDGRTAESEALVRAAAARNQGYGPGDRVTVCLRPEALELVVLVPSDARPASDVGPAPSPNLLTGVMRLGTYLGSVMACEIELPGGIVIRAQSSNPRSYVNVPEGAAVTVRFTPDDVLLLKARG